MIQVLLPGEATLKELAFEETPAFRRQITAALWIDLLHPTPEEELSLENILGLEIPSREEMHEISESSRLFVEKEALYMSCWALCYETVIPQNASVTFILTAKHFVSIRYSDHHAFRVFNQSRGRLQGRKPVSTACALVDLLEAMIGHIASTLRLLEQDLNSLSTLIFSEQDTQRKAAKKVGLKQIVHRIGKRNAVVSNLRESLVSLSTLTPFLIGNATWKIVPDLSGRMQTIKQDIKSLSEYDAQLSAEITFLLDSTIGLISVEQNQSMKVLSIAAVLVAFI